MKRPAILLAVALAACASGKKKAESPSSACGRAAMAMMHGCSTILGGEPGGRALAGCLLAAAAESGFDRRCPGFTRPGEGRRGAGKGWTCCSGGSRLVRCPEGARWASRDGGCWPDLTACSSSGSNEACVGCGPCPPRRALEALSVVAAASDDRGTVYSAPMFSTGTSEEPCVAGCERRRADCLGHCGTYEPCIDRCAAKYVCCGWDCAQAPLAACRRD